MILIIKILFYRSVFICYQLPNIDLQEDNGQEDGNQYILTNVFRQQLQYETVNVYVVYS